MTRILLLLPMLALPLLPQAAAAQRIDSPFRFVDATQTLGLFGGWFATETGPIDAAPRPGAHFGARYGLRLGGPFDAELDVFTSPTTRMVYDTILVAGEFRQVGETDATLLGALAALRFNITGPRTWYGIQPFVVFGGGAVMNLSRRSPLDDEVPEDVRVRFGTRFAGQLGGGAEWYATDRLSLRLDARGVLWRLTTPETFRRGERAELVGADEWSRNDYFTIGIGYHF
jgi:hypothetical protein